MASVKSNILLNGLNTITGIIFPVITFPYAARVLLPEGIGAVNFLNSIVDYIVLLTSLGIPMYAVREIAKRRDNQLERDRTAVEIFLLSCILCLIGYILVWILADFVPRIHEQSAIFYILSLAIFFNAIGVNWFYQGLEDFRFITVRAIIVRTLAAVSLFVFVKDASDLLIYAVIVVASTVGNNFINFIHLRHYIGLRSLDFDRLDIMQHLMPAVQVFAISLIISLYIRLNTIMLGFMTNDETVGIYVAGIKITLICRTLIASIGTVMIPHCANVYHKGDIQRYSQLIRKSLNLTLLLSLPLFVGGFVLAKPLIMLFCGADYYDSILVYRLDSPLLVLGCLSNLVAIQVLFTQNKNNLVIACVSSGAIVNIIMNLILIPRYGAYGTTVSAIIAESCVFISSLLLGKRFIPFNINKIFNVRYIAVSIIMGVVVYLVMKSLDTYVLQVSLGIISGGLVFALILYKMRDPMLMEMLLWIKGERTKTRNYE